MLSLFRFKRLQVKILVYSAIPITLVFAALIAVFAKDMYRNLVRDRFRSIDREVDNVAMDIELHNQEAIKVPEIMALAQENGLFGKRRESIEYAKKVLASHPQFTGVYFGYEPNADQQDAEFAGKALDKTAAAAVDKSGRFLPYWFRDRGNEKVIKLEPLVNMETSFYYQGNKNRFLAKPEKEGVDLSLCPLSSLYSEDSHMKPGTGSGIMTEPYVYQGKLIVEQTYPIVLNGRFMGIAGVDRALSSIDKMIKSLKPYETADFFLLSCRGRVIAASMDGKVTTNDEASDAASQRIAANKIEDTPYATILSGLYKNRTGVKPFVQTDPVLDEPFVYVSAKIPTGQWTLVMRVAESEVLQPVYNSLQTATVVTLGGIAVIWLVLWLLSRSVSRCIGSTASVTQKVAEGDLTQNLCSENLPDDETGLLIRSVHAMIDNLNQLLGQVKKSSIQLISTATEIEATSEEQKNSVNNFGTSTNQIAATVKQISGTSRELVGTMENVTSVVDGTAHLAEEGVTSLSTMESSMTQLGTATQLISGKLTEICEKTDKINNVISTITEVADQTNLLSLNAAIEAEKAGEHGIGFSVVAREIRRLADQTAVSTLDIEVMVNEMLEAVAAGVTEMEKFNSQFRHCQNVMAQINHQLAQIIGQVRKLPEQFEQVIDGMRSQSEGAHQISESIALLAETAEQTAASAEEFNQASRQLKDAVQGISDGVSRFKVEGA